MNIKSVNLYYDIITQDMIINVVYFDGSFKKFTVSSQSFFEIAEELSEIIKDYFSVCKDMENMIEKLSCMNTERKDCNCENKSRDNLSGEGRLDCKACKCR